MFKEVLLQHQSPVVDRTLVHLAKLRGIIISIIGIVIFHFRGAMDVGVPEVLGGVLSLLKYV